MHETPFRYYAAKAQSLAETGHDGQFRNDGVTPYITHVAGVASRFTDDDMAEAVAWLHDYLEDVLKVRNITDLAKGRQFLLDQGFHPEIVRAVALMTHLPDENYVLYIEDIKTDKLARRVKIQDILYNLSDSPSPRQVKKYSKALSILIDI